MAIDREFATIETTWELPSQKTRVGHWIWGSLGVLSLILTLWWLQELSWLRVVIVAFIAILAGVELIVKKDVRSFSLLMGGFVFIAGTLLPGRIFPSPDGTPTAMTNLAGSIALFSLCGVLFYNLIAITYLGWKSLWLLLLFPLQAFFGLLSILHLACAIGNGCL